MVGVTGSIPVAPTIEINQLHAAANWPNPFGGLSGGRFGTISSRNPPFAKAQGSSSAARTRRRTAARTAGRIWTYSAFPARRLPPRNAMRFWFKVKTLGVWGTQTQTSRWATTRKRYAAARARPRRWRKRTRV